MRRPELGGTRGEILPGEDEAAKLDSPASRLAWARRDGNAGGLPGGFRDPGIGWRQYENKAYLSPMGEVAPYGWTPWPRASRVT